MIFKRKIFSKRKTKIKIFFYKQTQGAIMLTLKKGNVEPITQQLFSLIYSSKLNEDFEIETFLYSIIASEPLIQKEFKSKKYDKQLEMFDKIEEIDYNLSQSIENFNYKIIIAKSFVAMLHGLTIKHKSFTTYINFINFLAYHHEVIYLYLYERGCFKNINDQIEFDFEKI